MIPKYKKILLMLISVCVIMFIVLKTFAYGDMAVREVHYKIGNTVDYVFDIFTDCIKFHTKANGYEKYRGTEMRSILFKALQNVECRIKSLFAYSYAKITQNPYDYKNIDNYDITPYNMSATILL